MNFIYIYFMFLSLGLAYTLFQIDIAVMEKAVTGNDNFDAKDNKIGSNETKIFIPNFNIQSTQLFTFHGNFKYWYPGSP